MVQPCGDEGCQEIATSPKGAYLATPGRTFAQQSSAVEKQTEGDVAPPRCDTSQTKTVVPLVPLVQSLDEWLTLPTRHAGSSEQFDSAIRLSSQAPAQVQQFPFHLGVRQIYICHGSSAEGCDKACPSSLDD